jgi:hypothetical protein
LVLHGVFAWVCRALKRPFWDRAVGISSVAEVTMTATVTRAGTPPYMARWRRSSTTARSSARRGRTPTSNLKFTGLTQNLGQL